MINRIKVFFGQNGMTTVNTTENTDAFGNVTNSHSMITNLNNGQASTIFDNTNHFGNMTTSNISGNFGADHINATTSTAVNGNNFTSNTMGSFGDNSFHANLMGAITNNHLSANINGNIGNTNINEHLDSFNNLHNHINNISGGHWENGRFITDNDDNDLLGHAINHIADLI